MSAVKLIVMYPTPKDVDAFERAYASEHIPMATPIFKSAGATKAVLSKASGSPSSAFHRIAEIHFPSMDVLEACAASADGQAALAHAHQISNGGPPVVMVAEEETVTF